MKQKTILLKKKLCQIVAGTCAVTMLSAGFVWAGPGGPGGGGPGGPGGGAYPNPGQIVPQLGPGAGRVAFGGRDFFMRGGVFYEHGPRGYQIVRPPLGLRIDVLPPGFETVVVAGLTYFLVSGIYYQQVGTSYVVVNPPSTTTVVTTSAADSNELVVVDTDLLNVRSGPDAGSSVVSQVSRGQKMIVKGQAPDWYYVQLPNGSSGWIMAKYVKVIYQPANG